MDKYKAKLVTKGYTQQHKVDCIGIFATVWIRDYEKGGQLKEDDEAMFVVVDPIYFDDAVMSEKWRKAIYVEIEAIKEIKCRS